MKTIDLGFKRPDYSTGCCNPVEVPKPPAEKTFYPSISVQDKPGLAKAVNVGQEITAVVKFKVVEIMAREGGNQEYMPGDCCRVELEAQSMTFENLNISESADEEDGSSAIKKFFSKKD